MLNIKKYLFSPGFEPGTFCVLDRCDNHYTTKTSYSTYSLTSCLCNPKTPKNKRYIIFISFLTKQQCIHFQIWQCLMFELGLLIDKYQRVFRTDGKWIKRHKYPLEIPLRDNFDDEYQEIYYKKEQHKEVISTANNNSLLGKLFLYNRIPPESKLAGVCEYIGMV